jgi:hypothetical protein
VKLEKLLKTRALRFYYKSSSGCRFLGLRYHLSFGEKTAEIGRISQDSAGGKTACRVIISIVEYPFPPVGIVGAADGKNRRAFFCLFSDTTFTVSCQSFKQHLS